MASTSVISDHVSSPPPSTPQRSIPGDDTRRSSVAVFGRERRIFWLFIGIWIVNGFDLGFTQLAFEQGVLEELNPLACHLLPHGFGVLVLYKCAMLGAGTLILWRYRQYSLAEGVLWLYAMFCVFLAVQWHLFFMEINSSWLFMHWCQEILPYGKMPFFKLFP